MDNMTMYKFLETCKLSRRNGTLEQIRTNKDFESVINNLPTRKKKQYQSFLKSSKKKKNGRGNTSKLIL